MQADLDKAHESGDEATNALRQQLQRAIEELESFKTKAKQSYDEMESRLRSDAQKEVSQMKTKYE